MAIEVFRVNDTVVIVTRQLISHQVLVTSMVRASREAIEAYSVNNTIFPPPLEALLPTFVTKLQAILRQAYDETIRSDEVSSTTN